jgi:outer membrane receptor for ferrienterochelin and colicin
VNATVRRRPGFIIGCATVAGIGTIAAAERSPDGDHEEIVVNPSRIQQRMEDLPVPVIGVSRDEIDRSSLDSIGKVLQQMPMVTGSPVHTSVENAGDGSVRIDLHGLGAARSLVLVNGCRTTDAALYQDLHFAYSSDAGPDVSLAILNLTNSDPPRVQTGPGPNTDAATYPLLGRTHFVSLGFRIA